MSDFLKPFFDAARPAPASPPASLQSRYFLGLRIKNPGADLVLFRHDGAGENGAPRGSGHIFHYSGNTGDGGIGDRPHLVAIQNIRNTFLFEVSRAEYQAVEGHLTMMCLNGTENPYYFSRYLTVMSDSEIKGRKPTDYEGRVKQGYENDACDYFMMEEDATPQVGVNCVYLALSILKHHGRIDLNAIDPDMAKARTGAEMEPVFQRIKKEMTEGTFDPSAKRTCLIFSETGELAAQLDRGTPAPPTVKKPFMAPWCAV